jgi:P27 family predicted phage terminase small subunit
MRGRKPKPTRLKILNGNPGKRPLNDSEPRPPSGAPTCPAHLDAEAKKEWRRVAKLLDGMGLLAKTDRAALAGYCVAYSRWVKAELILRDTGEILKAKDSGQPFQNPWLAVANRAQEQMSKYLAEFGLTPSSRVRLHAAPAAPQLSPMMRLLADEDSA